jgi:arylsulfatase A-like enzyme
MPRQYNIVYLHAHDAGRMVLPYGYNAPTPRLQAFAEQGITFRNAFCAAPSCSPSRAALLTGRYPHCCGMHGLASPYFRFALDQPERHLSHYLRNHGYETALAGTQHEVRAPLVERIPPAIIVFGPLCRQQDGWSKPWAAVRPGRDRLPEE